MSVIKNISALPAPVPVPVPAQVPITVTESGRVGDNVNPGMSSGGGGGAGGGGLTRAASSVFTVFETADGVNQVLCRWSERHDEALVHWIEALGHSEGKHPLHIDIRALANSRQIVATLASRLGGSNPSASSSSLSSVAAAASATYNLTINEDPDECVVDIMDISELFSEHSDEDIASRALLLLHLNDLLLPLLPLVAPFDGVSNVLGGRSHPTKLLVHMRHLVLVPVLEEFTHKVCVSQVRPHALQFDPINGLIKVLPGVPLEKGADSGIPSASNSQAHGSSPSTLPMKRLSSTHSVVTENNHWSMRSATSDGFGRSGSAGVRSVMVLEVEEEAVVADRVLHSFRAGGGDSNGFGAVSTSTSAVTIDPRWKLVAAIRSSLVGQMLHHFEALAMNMASITIDGILPSPAPSPAPSTSSASIRVEHVKVNRSWLHCQNLLRSSSFGMTVSSGSFSTLLGRCEVPSTSLHAAAHNSTGDSDAHPRAVPFKIRARKVVYQRGGIGAGVGVGDADEGFDTIGELGDSVYDEERLIATLNDEHSNIPATSPPHSTNAESSRMNASSSSPSSSASVLTTAPSDLFKLLLESAPRHASSYSSARRGFGGAGAVVSEWTLYSAFIVQALEQVSRKLCLLNQFIIYI